MLKRRKLRPRISDAAILNAIALLFAIGAPLAVLAHATPGPVQTPTSHTPPTFPMLEAELVSAQRAIVQLEALGCVLPADTNRRDFTP